MIVLRHRNRQVFEFEQDIGHLNVLGTILLTRITPQAIPEHVGFEDEVAQPHFSGLDDLMRQQAEGLPGILIVGHHGTGIRAGAATVAGPQ